MSLTVRKVTAWLERGGKSPAEQALKARLPRSCVAVSVPNEKAHSGFLVPFLGLQRTIMGGVALAVSISFHVSWKQGASQVMSWADDVRDRLQKADEYRESEKQFRLHKIRVLQDNAPQIFLGLMRSAKEGISQLREQRNDLAEVVYEERDARNFQVRNNAYPAIAVDIRLVEDGILYTRATLRDASDTGHVTDQGKITFNVDSSDRIEMRHEDRFVAGKDQLLHILLDPVFRISN